MRFLSLRLKPKAAPTPKRGRDFSPGDTRRLGWFLRLGWGVEVTSVAGARCLAAFTGAKAATGDVDGGPGLPQADRDAATEAARGAGDEGHPAGEGLAHGDHGVCATMALPLRDRA
jgi:hypothetical protein